MKAVFCAGMLLFVVFYGQGYADDPMNGPFAGNSTVSDPSPSQTSPVKLILTNMISFYSTVISPADGPRSPSYPTGSAYGRQAVERYGFFPGIFLITDRLLHESDVNLGPTLIIYGKKRYFDPVANNTFWWDDAVLAEVNP